MEEAPTTSKPVGEPIVVWQNNTGKDEKTIIREDFARLIGQPIGRAVIGSPIEEVTLPKEPAEDTGGEQYGK